MCGHDDASIDRSLKTENTMPQQTRCYTIVIDFVPGGV
jgi:hypothetical protein